MNPELEARDPRSVGDLLGALSRETGVLVRQELQLAVTETKAKALHAGHAASVVAVGGAAIHLGALALLAALVAGLGAVMPIWLGALIVGAVVAATGTLVVRAGIRALSQIDPIPREAVREIRTDTTLVKESMR
ncbi:MAG TPA: phage holin family protein [Polyangiaceae bacterium]|jgi:hypothetical protein|nr:phage holin family protein [Polyangiaceae bacterium]